MMLIAIELSADIAVRSEPNSKLCFLQSTTEGERARSPPGHGRRELGQATVWEIKLTRRHKLLRRRLRSLDRKDRC